MKNACFYTLTIFATVLGFSTATLADPTCDTTFTPDEGAWSDDGNWDSGGPTSITVACIPAGKTAMVYYALCVGGEYDGQECSPNPCHEECVATPKAEAEAIWIQASGATIGKIELRKYKTLTLVKDSGYDDDSQIDGELFLTCPYSELIASGGVTITGDGGEIVSEGSLCWSEFTTPPIIKTTPGGRLTLECDPEGDGSQEECIVVRGALDIQATLENNAYVIADDYTIPAHRWGDLMLTTNPKDGSGYWIAEFNTTDQTYGVLDVKVSVSESGTWQVKGEKHSEIRINAACTELTGDVLVENGTLLVKQNFETTGNLVMENDGGTYTFPKIIVWPPRIARFNVTE